MDADALSGRILQIEVFAFCRYCCQEKVNVMVKKISPIKNTGGVMTQRELARAAGVSMTTIYNVLHQPHLVNPETLKAIRKIMSDCDYFPDALAQAMVRGKSNIVGVVVPRLDIPYFANLVCQLERNISKKKYKCLILQHYDDPKIARESIRTLRQYRVDGIVLRCCSQEEDIALVNQVEKYQLPFVLLDEIIPGFEAFTVQSANFEDAANGVKKLFSLGCRRIAYIGWHRKSSDDLGPRFAGWKAAMQSFGLPCDSQWHRKATEEYGVDQAEIINWWRSFVGQQPDGIICSNTSIALGVCGALRELAVDIPEKVKLLGFGGDIYQALLGPKTILSVRQDITGLAEAICQVLCLQMEQNIKPTELKSIPSFIWD